MAVRKSVVIKPSEEQIEYRAHIEGRVGRLEGAVENLTHEVQETAKAVRDISGTLGKFKEDVLGHIGQATAPKWPLIMSFIMMCLTIIGLGGTVVSQNISGQSLAISKLDTAVKDIRDKSTAQNFTDGQQEAWRLQANETLKNLDEKLQKEIALANAKNDKELKELHDFIVNLKDWRLEHTQANAREMGEFTAKFDELMRYVYRIEERQYKVTCAVSQLDYLRPGGNNDVFKKIGEPCPKLDPSVLPPSQEKTGLTK